MRNAIFALRFLCLFSFWLAYETADAGNLSVGGDNVVWNPAVDGPISPSLMIYIANDTTPDADLLQGWQLRLMIMPGAESQGTLEFNSRSLPSADYLLEGASAGLGGSLAANELFAFDDDPGFTGVEVPPSGKSLLELNFSRSDEAQGAFKILAVPGLANSQWSDGNFSDREFTNVPLSSTEPVVLGTVTVVPEPSTAVLGLMAIPVVLAMVRLRKRDL